MTAPIGKHIGKLSALGLLDHETGHRSVVVYRMRVRHRAHRRKTAGHRGGRAAGNRLFVFLARLAQVHVHVDETGRNNQARRVDNFSVFRASDRYDLSVRPRGHLQ